MDLKGRPDRREGKKVSGGHFFSPWENHSLMDALCMGVDIRLSCVAGKYSRENIKSVHKQRNPDPFRDRDFSDGVGDRNIFPENY